MQVLAQTIIGDIIPPRDRNKYQGITSATFGISVIAGPLLGGVVTDRLGWRWLFLVTVPVALLTLGAAALTLRSPAAAVRRHGGCPRHGALCRADAIVIVSIQVSGWLLPIFSLQTGALALLAIATAVVLVRVELRTADPLLSVRLWRKRAFTFANVGMIGSAVALYGAVYFVPLFAQGCSAGPLPSPVVSSSRSWARRSS